MTPSPPFTGRSNWASTGSTPPPFTALATPKKSSAALSKAGLARAPTSLPSVAGAGTRTAM